MIFPLHLYYTKFSIYTMLALPITGRVNPITLKVAWILLGPHHHRLWSHKYGIKDVRQPLEWYFHYTCNIRNFPFRQANYACYWLFKPNSFWGSTGLSGATFSMNMKPQIWDTGCKPVLWMIFPLKQYISPYQAS